jgi:hypothetical protein
VAEPTTAFVTDIVFDRVAISLSDALRFAFSGMLVNARNSLQLRVASRRAPTGLDYQTPVVTSQILIFS